MISSHYVAALHSNYLFCLYNAFEFDSNRLIFVVEIRNYNSVVAQIIQKMENGYFVWSPETLEVQISQLTRFQSVVLFKQERATHWHPFVRVLSPQCSLPESIFHSPWEVVVYWGSVYKDQIQKLMIKSKRIRRWKNILTHRHLFFY
jgi:hypothetical protein